MLAFEPSTAFLVTWAIFLVVATLVTLFVALLLFRLAIACVKLNRHAEVADIAAKPVKTNTDPVPQLAESLGLIRDVLGVARTVERHGAELEKVLLRDGALR